MISLAAMSMLTPLMLWGLGMLFVPIAAHLLNRRARHRIVFPSLRLLRESSATQSTLFRLRRLILLLLRCLLAALIVLAFARPIWHEGPAPGSGTLEGTGTVIVLDTSASTGRLLSGAPVLESIKAAAGRTLSSLGSGDDLADVVLASARPRAIFGQLVPNMQTLGSDLTRLTPTSERADFPAAMEVAGRLLATVKGDRRVVVISDRQRTNWSEAIQGAALGDLLPAETEITVVDVEAPPSPNVALSAPRCYPAQPVAGQPMSLTVRVTNFSEREAPVRIDLQVDDTPTATRTAILGPWEIRDLAFDLTLADARRHEIVFTSEPDGLIADDFAYLAIEVARRVPIVVVGDDDPDEPGSGSYFITRALAPRGDTTDPFAVRFIGSGELHATALAGAAAVVVGDVAWIEDQAAWALLEYVGRGGGLIWLCGNGPVAENIVKLETLGDAPLTVFPWRCGWARDLGSAGGATQIATGSWRDRGLRAFDEQSQLALSQIRFTRVWTADLRDDARVLLAYDDGTPALASRVFQSGRIMQANFSPALEAGDLGKYGAFVALLQGLVSQVRPMQSPHETLVVGPALRLDHQLPPGDRAGGLDLVGPNGARLERAEIVDDQGRITVQLPRTETAGFYRLVDGERVLTTVALNVDPRESDPRTSDGQQIARAVEVGGWTPSVAGLGGPGPILDRDGTPLWSWCAIAAMVLLGMECIAISFWRR